MGNNMEQTTMEPQENVAKYESLDALGLEGLGYTESSNKDLSQPEAVNFAARKGPGIVLASALEVAALRIVAKGKYNANEYQPDTPIPAFCPKTFHLKMNECQRTRTGALYIKIDGKWYCAVDDTPDASKNIVIARAQEGCNAHNEFMPFLLSKDDPLVKAHLNRAELSDRIFEVPEDPRVCFAAQQREGKSEFGQDKHVRAFLGQVSEPYAGWINEKCDELNKKFPRDPPNKFAFSYVWTSTPSDLENIEKDKVEIRPVSLGWGDNNLNIGGISAGGQFSIQFDTITNIDGKVIGGGRAPGVRSAKEYRL